MTPFGSVTAILVSLSGQTGRGIAKRDDAVPAREAVDLVNAADAIERALKHLRPGALAMAAEEPRHGALDHMERGGARIAAFGDFLFSLAKRGPKWVPIG